MKRRTGACVVLYNPDKSVIDNIRTYCLEVDVCIVIDNSPVRNDVLVAAIMEISGNILYEWLQENKGIATALNVACRIAMEHHCEWLLTMDQDSHFGKEGVSAMISCIHDVEDAYNVVGILSADHKVHEEAKLKAYTIDEKLPSGQTERFTELSVVMASGNLLNLQSYRSAGPFADKLFIDHVDHEYCLRLRKNKYRIIQVNSVILHHSLGSFKIRSLFGKKMKVSNHNYLRRYYITRNGLYVARHYFFVDRKLCFDILANILFFDMIKILFLEHGKLLKLKAVGKGMYHFMINRYGKY